MQRRERTHLYKYQIFNIYVIELFLIYTTVIHIVLSRIVILEVDHETYT